MKKLLISSIGSLLLIPSLTPILPISLQKAVATPKVAQSLTMNQIRQLGQAVTVQVISPNSQGSGVIIARSGNTYTIITNAHVVYGKESYQIQTPDNKLHAATIIHRGNSLEGNDLAVLEFQSPNAYQVVPLATNPNLTPNQLIWAAGFPNDSSQIAIIQGRMTLLSPKPFIGGYQIGYDVDIKPGMSGGALLNQKGELIGINGLTRYPILDDAYTYQDGSRPNDQQIETYQQVSFAVPIQTLALVAPELAIIPAEWKAGFNKAENVDQIAQQITVRIDNATGVEGSGVIIGKVSNTYYVATACHVLVNTNITKPCNRENVLAKFSIQQYTLVTPDGEKHPITIDKITISENSDAALIEFTSNKTHEIAKLGKYTPHWLKKHWSFISGFPAGLDGKRKLAAGYRYQEDRGLMVAFDNTNLKIKTTGYELIYSNLSEHGMSGGPVLDTDGQVIGINGGVEGDWIDLKLGYAFGVPITSVVELAKTKFKPNQLQISTNKPIELKETDIATLKTHSSFIVDRPDPNAIGQNIGRELINYGNRLWRLERYEEAITTLQKVINDKDNDGSSNILTRMV
jgi:S1-C subfamily serine protease